MVAIAENKPNRPKTADSSRNQLGNWAIWLGSIIAVISAFISLPYKSLILVILGVIGGYLIISDKDAHHFVVFALGLWLGTTAIESLLSISENVSILVSIGKNLVTLFASSALLVSIKAFARLSGILK